MWSMSFANDHSPQRNFKKVVMNLIRNICSEITLLELLPYLAGANELN